jgi:hypothetical protein
MGGPTIWAIFIDECGRKMTSSRRRVELGQKVVLLVVPRVQEPGRSLFEDTLGSEADRSGKQAVEPGGLLTAEAKWIR